MSAESKRRPKRNKEIATGSFVDSQGDVLGLGWAQAWREPQVSADKPKRGPGRPPLPPGVKHSTGNPLIQVRCEPELAAFIQARGGPAFLRWLAERERSSIDFERRKDGND